MMPILFLLISLLLLAGDQTRCGSMMIVETRYSSDKACTPGLAAKYLRHTLNTQNAYDGMFELINATTLRRTFPNQKDPMFNNLGECKDATTFTLVDDQILYKRYAFEVQKFTSTPNSLKSCNPASNYENLLVPSCHPIYGSYVFHSRMSTCTNYTIGTSFCFDPFCLLCVAQNSRPKADCEFTQNPQTEERIELMNDLCWKNSPKAAAFGKNVHFFAYFVVVVAFMIMGRGIF